MQCGTLKGSFLHNNVLNRFWFHQNLEQGLLTLWSQTIKVSVNCRNIFDPTRSNQGNSTQCHNQDMLERSQEAMFNVIILFQIKMIISKNTSLNVSFHIENIVFIKAVVAFCYRVFLLETNATARSILPPCISTCLDNLV